MSNRLTDERLANICAAPWQDLDDVTNDEIVAMSDELKAARAQLAKMDGVRIRTFYLDGCSDRHGARVWASVTEGPCRAEDGQTRWTIYHRPECDEMFPANLTHVGTFDDAVRIGRKLVDALNALSTPTDAKEDAVRADRQSGVESAASCPTLTEEEREALRDLAAEYRAELFSPDRPSIALAALDKLLATDGGERG